MSESSSSRDEKDIAEEGNQDVEVIYGQIRSGRTTSQVEDDEGIEKPKWKDLLREQC